MARIHRKTQALEAVGTKERLGPLFAEEHERGHRAAIRLQACFTDFPSRPSPVGELHRLLADVPNFQRRENFVRHDSEEGTAIDQETESALELRLARMAQRTLNVKNRHRSLIVVTNKALSNVTKS